MKEPTNGCDDHTKKWLQTCPYCQIAQRDDEIERLEDEAAAAIDQINTLSRELAPMNVNTETQPTNLRDAITSLESLAWRRVEAARDSDITRARVGELEWCEHNIDVNANQYADITARKRGILGGEDD